MDLAELIVAMQELTEGMRVLLEKTIVAKAEIEDPTSTDEYKAMIRLRLKNKLGLIVQAITNIQTQI